jgi:hypothetical protein
MDETIEILAIADICKKFSKAQQQFPQFCLRITCWAKDGCRKELGMNWLIDACDGMTVNYVGD